MFVITGSVAYDYIMNFPGSYSDHILAESLHKINLSFNVDNFEKRRGGTAGNVSYTLSKLSTPNILFTVAGKDFDEYKKDFEKLKIDTSKIVIDKTKNTSTGFAMTDKNDNQIWGFFMGASDKIENLKLKNIATKKDIVLVGPSSAKGSMNILNQCIEYGIPFIFDPGFILTEISISDLTKGIKNCSYIFGNDYEIELIKKRVKKFDSLTQKKVVIKTLGSNGVELIENGKSHFIKSVKVKKAIDPTGAGDAFRAGFIAGLERKFDILTCARMGSVAGAYAVEMYGTQEHNFTIPDFKKRYRQNYNSLLDL